MANDATRGGAMVGRRGFLIGLGALALPGPAGAAVPAFLSAHGNAAGGNLVARFDAAGAIRYDLALPERGHGIALAPDGRTAIAVARRPGRFLQAFDSASGQPTCRVAPADGFFYCGHAAFDRTGARLFATETRAEDGAGYIGVYDTRAAFRRVAAWPTRGCDPHELLVFGDDLVVANGGFGQEGDPIDPSLVRIDSRDGAIVAQVRPPGELSDVSLRHLARAGGAAFVVGQYAGPSQDRPPLVARWDRAGLRFIDLPQPALDGLANYCGSIAAAADGSCLCTASPRGGQAVVFAPDGTVLDRVAVPDVCGIAPMAQGFLLTGGRGDLVATASGSHASAAARWDNHVVALSA